MPWWGKKKKTPSRKSEAKGGWVYLGESVRKDGKKMNYVGSTTRTVKQREKEHKREVGKKKSSTWVGKGKSYKTKLKRWSRNPRRDEKRVKSMSTEQKKKWFSGGKKTKSVSKKSTTKRSSKSRKTTKSYSPTKRKTKYRKSATKKPTTNRTRKPQSKSYSSAKRKTGYKKSTSSRKSSGRRRSSNYGRKRW